MINFLKNSKKGFTLIELLLYLGMTVSMVVLIGGIGVNVLSSIVSAREQEELQYNGQFIIEKLRTVIAEAESIQTPVRTATSTILILQMNDSSKNPTIINTVDGNIRIKEGDVDFQIISGSNVVVSGILFSNVTYENGNGSVRMAIDIGLNNSADFSSTSFNTTINLQ